jgi:hypothetical protein
MWHSTPTKEKRDDYNVLTERPEGKAPLGRHELKG